MSEITFNCEECRTSGFTVTGPHSHVCCRCGDPATYGFYTTPLCTRCKFKEPKETRVIEEQGSRLDQTINRTANLECPACNESRQHAAAEWTQFHPDAGTGTALH